ncbi:MAG: hypothetical protein ACR2ND_07630 [Solirubrobacteraceae bacterium]
MADTLLGPDDPRWTAINELDVRDALRSASRRSVAELVVAALGLSRTAHSILEATAARRSDDAERS